MAAFSHACSIFTRQSSPHLSALLQCPPTVRQSAMLLHMRLLARHPQLQHLRRFSNIQCLRQKAAPKPALKPTARTPPSPTSVSRPTRPSPSGAVTIGSLAARSSPTVLYTAPTSKIPTICAYSMTTYFLGVAAWIWQKYYIDAPPGLHWMVPVGYGVISIFLGGMSLRYLYSTSGFVRRISAVPVRHRSSPTVKLRVEMKPSMPWAKPRVFEVPPSDVSVAERFSNPSWTVYGVGKASEMHYQAYKRRLEWQELKQQPAWVRPFLKFGKIFYQVMLNTRYTLSWEHAIGITVQGQSYKIDPRGEMLEEGQAIDRLVRLV